MQIRNLDLAELAAEVKAAIEGSALDLKQRNSLEKAWNKAHAAWADWGEGVFPAQLRTGAGRYSATFANLTSRKLAEKYGADYPWCSVFQTVEEIFEWDRCDCDVPAILEHATHWVAERMERDKQAQSTLGFDDLLTRLDAALDGDNAGALADAIAQQFPVAMIDEFQDTDPVQYQIFDRIFAPERGTTMVMIGDPKQAIYSFRGADIFTYLAARQDAGDRLFTLDTNYRSATGMVEAVNRVFDYGQQQRGTAFLLNQFDAGGLPFNSVNPNGIDKRWVVEHQTPNPMTLCTLTADDFADITNKQKTKCDWPMRWHLKSPRS